MKKQTRACINCGASVTVCTDEPCKHCGASAEGVDGAVVFFTDEARDEGAKLGGLLELFAVDGRIVKFVGYCPAGAYGIDDGGHVVWKEDWGWMSSCEWKGGRLYLAGEEADPDSGKIVPPAG